MYIEDTKSETGTSQYRKRWETERSKQIEVIEAVLQTGVQQKLFKLRNFKVEARILRDMVRSVLITNLFSHEKKMTQRQMTDTIMHIFLRGIEKKT